MKRLNTDGVGRGGYTIIETLIVLAASSFLVVVVILLITSQQGKTQFTQAARDADARLNDIVNDYATGYLVRTNNVSCTADGGGGRPALTSSTSNQGTNIGCVYVGRLVRFTPDSSSYTVHSLIGRQYVAGVFSQQTSDIVSAKPVLLYPTTSNSSIPNLAITDEFGAGIRFKSAVYLDTSNNPQSVGAFAIVSNFGTTSGGSLVSDKQTPQLMILTPAFSSDTDLADRFATGITTADFVTDRPMALCFESSSSKQYAIIKFGTNGGGSITTTTTIAGGDTCPAVLF